MHTRIDDATSQIAESRYRCPFLARDTFIYSTLRQRFTLAFVPLLAGNASDLGIRFALF
ncbi:hypothetical protein RMSM_06559 [Rhodopirellula maiorica SM1]|uniref:Uncharacterized protein n=1 Tax=Rhodopirellula maiorica SM1 TaxID=1265738 RepID=M5RAV8_9BACT|nr:hypothetical protein RMSM_06559 [Rhodopirellula maiorica SM1]